MTRASQSRGLVDRLRPYVPPHVFQHLAESRDEIPSERRHVTVIFADLSGFTTMSERLDPEDVARITNEALTRLAQPVIDRDGTIDKFIGDALMAVFGAPISHPDDARRALEAAWDMRRAIQDLPDLDLSIGIHTGLAISGNVGNANRREYTVIGDAVNVASRLEGKARRGEILVSEQTLREAGPSFFYGRRRVLRVKGRAQSVIGRPLSGRREMPPAPRWHLNPIFLGRDAELRKLEESVSRGGRIVVVGPAGMGKTVLMMHVTPRLSKSRRVVHVGARLNAAARPFQFIRDILRALRASRGGVPRPVLDEILDRLFKSELTPRQAALQLLRALGDAPTVLILEDLHRSDESSRSVLNHLGEDPRLSILATTRPGTAVEEILPQSELCELKELSVEARCELIRRLLGSPHLPPGAIALAQHIGGLPLAVEETVRHMVSQGHFYFITGKWHYWRTETTTLAPTVIIRSRLDTLSTPAREMVNEVAIFGSAPIPRIGGYLSNERQKKSVLRECVSAGILAREGPTVSFKHDFYRMVAYETILRRHRRDLHLRAAHILEKSGGAPGELADHYERAAADDSAFPHLIRAADRAAAFYAFATAESYLNRAGEIARRRRRSRDWAETLLRLAHVHLRVSRNSEAGRDLDKAERTVSRGRFSDLALNLWQRRATWAKNTGRIGIMRRYCRRILRTAASHGESRAGAYETLGAQLWREGKNIQAVGMYEHVLTMRRITHRTRMIAMNALADLYRITGRWSNADRLLVQILRQDRDAGWPLLHRGRLRLDQGRPDEAGRDLREALARARQNDDGRLAALVLRDLARAEIAHGRVDAGLSYLDQGLAAVRRIFSYQPRAFAEAALIYAKLDRAKSARKFLRQAETHHRKIRLVETEALLLETRTILANQTGNSAGARRLHRRLVHLRRKMGMRVPAG